MNFFKWLVGAVATMAAIGSVHADQSQLSSPTTGTVSGLSLTQNYNGALNALASCNSGASAPANTLSGTPVTGQCWLNTAASRYKLEIYDGSAWVVQATLDPATHQWLPQTGGGSATLASASATDLGSVAETAITITGTTAITSFGSNAPLGSVKIISAQSSGLVLIYGSATLVLPGNANIVMGAGDTAVAFYLGTGVWKVIAYQVYTSPANIRQVGTGANNLVALDSNAKLPAVDGSQIANLTGTQISGLQGSQITSLSGSASTTVRASTPVTLSGQTSVGFVSIPNWVKRITIAFAGLNASGNFIVQLGTGAGPTYQTTGYVSVADYIATTPGGSNSTSGFLIDNRADYGTYTFVNVSGNTWSMSGTGGGTGYQGTFSAGGVTLSGSLTALQLTNATFNGGTVNILWE